MWDSVWEQGLMGTLVVSAHGGEGCYSNVCAKGLGGGVRLFICVSGDGLRRKFVYILKIYESNIKPETEQTPPLCSCDVIGHMIKQHQVRKVHLFVIFSGRRPNTNSAPSGKEQQPAGSAPCTNPTPTQRKTPPI